MSDVEELFPATSALLQLSVLRPGFLQEWDVGVGVFPESEEIFVGGERPEALVFLLLVSCCNRVQSDLGVLTGTAARVRATRSGFVGADMW